MSNLFKLVTDCDIFSCFIYEKCRLQGGGSFCTRIPQVTSGILIHMRVALECIIKGSDTVLKPKSIYIYVATVSLT